MNGRSEIRRHELGCTNCRCYVQFSMDLSIDGPYTITCPNCQHDHYRMVQNGKVTEIRWGSSSPMQTASNIGWTSGSMDDSSTGSCNFTYDLWKDITSAG